MSVKTLLTAEDLWEMPEVPGKRFELVDGELVDQDLVAERAGTLLPEGPPESFVPAGASPRNDYRLRLPRVHEPARSGTAARPLAAAVEDLSARALACVPVAGPWNADRVAELVVVLGAQDGTLALLANLRTGSLWGTRPSADVLLAHLAGATVTPPEPEWDVGHFVSLAAAMRGPRGAFVVVRDTYPTLGWNGYHLQPPRALAQALARGDGREGGVVCVVRREAEEDVRARLAAAGYELRFWDNGTPEREVQH